MCCRHWVQVSYSQASTSARFFSSVNVVVSVTSARTWSKIGSSTLSKMRTQKGVVKAAPWNLSVSNKTCIESSHGVSLGRLPLDHCMSTFTTGPVPSPLTGAFACLGTLSSYSAGDSRAQEAEGRCQDLTSSALYLMSGLGSNVSSLRPANSGNQKYTCSSRSLNCMAACSASPAPRDTLHCDHAAQTCGKTSQLLCC